MIEGIRGTGVIELHNGQKLEPLRGHSADDAQDLTQSFFMHLLEHRALASVDRLKGKFRSFLLASFQNHLSDQIDRTRRLKKRGRQGVCA
jgi:DNA-directed RNA polymerase specialized sigma24 family protein